MRRQIAPPPPPEPPKAEPEPAPPPERHPLENLIRCRVNLAMKPDGNKVIEGVLMRQVLDGDRPGFLLHGSTINPAYLHEINDHGQPFPSELVGDLWIDHSDVLYVQRDSSAQTRTT